MIFLWAEFMSDILSRVQILLDANTARFEQSMRDAQETASNTFGRIIDGAKKMAPAVAAGSAIAIGAVTAMTKEYVDAAAEIKRFAEISGSTTDEFQRMSVGADTLGFEAEQLTDMFKDFNEKLGEFTTLGSGGAVDFFEKIALKTEGSAAGARKLALEMQQLSGPQALQLYVNKAEQAGVTSQQMSFYLESMASDTTKLLPLLKNGGEGFRFWADEAQRAGVIMDESTIQKAGELTVQMQLLDLRVKGAKNQFIEGFIPSLNSVSGALGGATAETNLLSDAGETLGTVLSGVAAIALGVYASVKLVTNAVSGLAVDAVSAKNMVDSASESGSWADKLPGVKLVKTAIYGATIAKAENSATSMAVEDNSNLVNDISNKINSLFDKTTSAAVKAMAEAKNGMNGLNDGSKEWVDKQNEAAKATIKHASAQKDVNKTYDDARKLLYEYGTEFQRIDRDLADESKLISGSALKVTAKTKMLAEAKEISAARKQVYLLEYEADLDSWSWTESEKLKKTLDLETVKIKATKGMSTDERKLRIESLNDVHKHEMAWLRLEQAERLNNSHQAFQTEIQNITARYEFQRERIRLDKSLSFDDREGLIGASEKSQDLENDARRTEAWSNFQSAAGIDTSAEDEHTRRNDAFKDALDWQLITQDEYQRRLLQSEQQYHIDRTNLTIDSYSGSLEATTGFFKTMLGESSSTYQALFMAQKMFALSQAGMNIWKAASDAFANEPGTVWQKMGAAAMATLEGGTFVAMIEAATPIAHGGLDYVPEETTYLLDKGERVLSPRQNTDFTNFLANQESGTGGDVYFTQHIEIASDGSAISQSDAKELGRIIENGTLATIRKELRQGGMLNK